MRVAQAMLAMKKRSAGDGKIRCGAPSQPAIAGSLDELIGSSRVVTLRFCTYRPLQTSLNADAFGRHVLPACCGWMILCRCTMPMIVGVWIYSLKTSGKQTKWVSWIILQPCVSRKKNQDAETVPRRKGVLLF